LILQKCRVIHRTCSLWG